MFQIIEDRSPYYVKFYHPSLHNIIDFVRSKKIILSDVWNTSVAVLRRQELEINDVDSFLRLLPMYSIVPELNKNSLALWCYPPGGFSNAHKDGLQNGCAINIPIDIPDDFCITSWYNDETLLTCVEDVKTLHTVNTNIVNWGYRSPMGFSLDKYVPDVSTIMKSNEFMLFNSNIWHSADNRKSPNYRRIMSIRFVNSEHTTYENIYNLLFS